MTSTLRRALRTDGAVSVAAGAATLAAVGPVSSFTGIPTVVTAAVGAGSLLLGGTFLAVSRLANVRAPAATVAGANALGTVIAVVVAATAAPPLTTAGVISVLAVGAYTAVIAAAQYRGVRLAS